LRGKSCTSHHKTIASNEVERFVVQQVLELLKCPEITAKTLKSLEGKISTDEAFAMLQQIDVIWDSLFPIEQYLIICLLIKAVLVREDGIDVRIHADGLQSLLLHAGMEARL
jgi:site-specific DNA recombinase